MAIVGYSKQAKLWSHNGRSRRGKNGVKTGQNGVYDHLIQKITGGIISTGQKTIPNTPIMPILSIQNYGVTRGKRGKRGAKRGLWWSNPKTNQWNRLFGSKYILGAISTVKRYNFFIKIILGVPLWVRGYMGLKTGSAVELMMAIFFWWLQGPYRIVWKINCSVPKKFHNRCKIQLDYYSNNFWSSTILLRAYSPF